MQAQHRKRSAKAHVEAKRTGRPAMGRRASSDKLGRADRLALAHFRRQLATGLLLQRHLTPGEPRTQACVFYTTPEFDTLWWFESLMVGQKVEVAFEDIVEVGVGPPKSAHAVDNAIAKFKKAAKHADDGDIEGGNKPPAAASRMPAPVGHLSLAAAIHSDATAAPAQSERHLEDVAKQRQLHICTRSGLVLHLATFSDEQRRHVLHGFRLAAAISATRPGSAHEGGARSLADAAALFAVKLANGDDDDDDAGGAPSPGMKKRVTSKRLDATPGGSIGAFGARSNSLGSAHSLLAHFTRHTYPQEFHPNYHHQYGIPAGTTVELGFSNKYAIVFKTTDGTFKELKSTVKAAEDKVRSASGDASDPDELELDVELADGALEDGKHHELGGADVLGMNTIAAANEESDNFKPGMWLLGEVVSYDDDSETYVIAYKRGPYDADVMRDMLFEYDGEYAPFPKGTEFIDVRRENLVVDYNEQHSAKPPIFIITISLIQILQSIIYIYAVRHGPDYASFEADSPISGPNWMWYKLVGDWPRCADQRGQIWRLWTYQFVHSGYVHLTGNVVMQCFFGIPIEMVHGPLAMMAIYWMGVITGALTCAMIDPYSNVVGASGGAYTVTGAQLANLILNWADMQKGIAGNHWTRLILLAIFFGYEAIAFFSSPVEHVSFAAHLGGWLCGLLFGLAVLHNLDFEHRAAHVIQKGAALLFFVYITTAIVWYATHWPPAYIIASTTGISERPCCFTAEICQPNMPLTVRDDLFKCPTGYGLQYRSPIAGSDFESGTAYDKCADLVSICEENSNATWCSN